jgi:hypothetical protein
MTSNEPNNVYNRLKIESKAISLQICKKSKAIT